MKSFPTPAAEGETAPPGAPLTDEARLASILETQQEMICRFGLDAKLTYVNRSYCGFVGRGQEELLGLSFLDLLPKERRQLVLAGLGQLSAEVPTRTYEQFVEREGADPVWVEWTDRAICDERGRVVEYQSVGRDVTARKRLEDALDRRMMALIQPLDSAEGIEMEALFNLADLQRLQDEFAAATGVASVITRPTGEPITRPSCFTRFCGLVRATEKGRESCFHSDAELGRGGQGKAAIRPCLSGGLWDAGAAIMVGGRHIANWLIGQVRDADRPDDDVRAFARRIGADEEELAGAFREVPVKSREEFGRIARMLHTLAEQLSGFAYQNVQQARFISDLKRAEEDLLTSADRMATVLDSLEAIVSISDLETHELLFLNEPGRKALGDVLGQPIWKAVQGLDAPAPQMERGALVDAGGQPSGVRQWEVQSRANGRWYDCRDSAIQWTDGRMVRLEIATDVTERKRAEEERKRLETHLYQAQKLETIGQLAGGVAHDFNNMLGVILGYTDLAMDSVAPGSPLREALDEIRKAAERSADLTRQLLGFARKQTIVPRVLDLNETVEGMQKMLLRLIGKHMALEWRPGRDLGPVKVDPSQIDQILVNLCLNARDAVGESGTVRIETSELEMDADACAGHDGAVPGTYLRLAVADDGCGMDAETLSHVFEPFFSTKDASEGAGLGLPTVYGIARQNNGFVKARSEPGKGTVVSVYFPVYGASGRSAFAEDDEASPALPESETILLVEDEPSLLNLTMGMLKRRGYKVVGASSPAEALRAAEKHDGPIDLLMTDVILPDMDGRELAEKVRALRPGIKLLFMSGHTADVLEPNGVLGEGVHFIQKPFKMKALASKLVQALSPGGSDWDDPANWEIGDEDADSRPAEVVP